MKKLSIIFLSFVLLTGCSSTTSDKVIKVGATAMPHAEILEVARSEVEKYGYKLKIIVFGDYVMPNKALANGDIDANYFQHQPYLDQQIDYFNYDFKNAGAIHVEPIKIYSQKYQKIDDIENGATLMMSNSQADQSRVLNILAKAKLITFKPGINPENVKITDIESNPKQLKFSADYDPSLLPKIYENGEADLIAINTNYALSAQINQKEVLLSEDEDSPYANILVVQSQNINSKKVEVLKNALTSTKVQTFIEDQYHGAVIPVTN